MKKQPPRHNPLFSKDFPLLVISFTISRFPFLVPIICVDKTIQEWRIKTLIFSLFLTLPLWAIDKDCQLQICSKIRAAELYLSNPEMPDEIVDEIEEFASNYPYSNQYSDQLHETYLPAIQRLRAIKQDLSECADSSLTQRLLQSFGTKIQEFFRCTNCQIESTLPQSGSSLDPLISHLTAGQPASTETLADSVASISKHNAVNRYVELEFFHSRDLSFNDMADHLCRRQGDQCIEEVMPLIRAKYNQLNSDYRQARQEVERTNQSDLDQSIVDQANQTIAEINSELDQIRPHAIIVPETVISDESFLYDNHFESHITYNMLWSDEDHAHYARAQELFSELNQKLGILTVAPTISKKIVEVIDALSSMGSLAHEQWNSVYELQRINNRSDGPQNNATINATYDFLEDCAEKGASFGYPSEGDIVYPMIPELLDYPMPPAVYQVRVKDRIPLIRRGKGDDAMDEVRDAIRDEMKKANDLDENNLHKAMVYNPLAVSEALMKNPNLAPYICEQVEKAEEMIERKEKVAHAVYIASAITGALSIPAILISGGTAGAVMKVVSSGLALVSGVLSTGMSTAQAIDTHNQMQQIQAALAAGNTGIEDISELNQTRKEFYRFLGMAVLDGAMTIADGVTLAKAIGELRSLRALQQAPTLMDEVIDVLRKSDSPDTTAVAIKRAIAEDPNFLNKLKNLPPDQLDEVMRLIQRHCH